MPMYCTDPRLPRGDLRTTNRQDSAGTAAMVASSISRIKKINFLIREIGGPSMTAASMESCRFSARRSPGGRLGSGIDMGSCLRRMRGRFDQWIQISTGPQQCADNYRDPPKFSIQSSVGSTKHRRMRSRGPPDPRSIPERVRAPICPPKK